jgi:hypothetical protein
MPSDLSSDFSLGINIKIAKHGYFYLVGWAGIEPATNGLKGRCSTN